MFLKYYKAYYEGVAREWTKLGAHSASGQEPSVAMPVVIMLLAPIIPFLVIVWLLPLSSGIRIGIGSIIILLFMVILPLGVAYKLYIEKKRK
jgi:hypothetical protein